MNDEYYTVARGDLLEYNNADWPDDCLFAFVLSGDSHLQLQENKITVITETMAGAGFLPQYWIKYE